MADESMGGKQDYIRKGVAAAILYLFVAPDEAGRHKFLKEAEIV